MPDYFVGPLALDDFLNKFVPVSSTYDPNACSGAFDEIRKCAAEEDVYEKFATCIADRGLCPGYTFVAAQNTVPENHMNILGAHKMDMVLHRDEDPPKSTGCSTPKPRWDRIVLYVDSLNHSPWAKCDPCDDCDTQLDDSRALQRRSTREQLMSRVAVRFACQQRTHMFSMIILGGYARIIRWDRAGAVFTERIDYVACPEKLAMFLWHFAHLDRRQQGYDDTAELIEEDSRLHNMMMKKIADGSKMSAKDKDLPEAYVLDYFKDSCDPDWPKWRLQVDVSVSPGDSAASASGAALGPTKPRYFLVGRPHFTAPGMTGRATRGYVALDEENNELVYLKDCWRVDLPDMTREGDVIQLMNNEGVQCVPTLVYHGDIEGQRTSTQEHWSGDTGKPSSFRPHQHYRLVVQEVGCPLSDFKHSEELVKVITECIAGHADAFVKAKILHRDISAGNILILRKMVDKKGQTSVVTRGLLNDWDLSISVADNNDGLRQPSRTGTWQFMSAFLLQKPWKSHELQDDLESFMHVLIYEAIRYLPHNCTDVGVFVKNFFDIASKSGNVITGGIWKIAAIRFRTLETPLGNDLKFYEPLQSLIDDLMSWFQAYYVMHDLSTPEQPEEHFSSKLAYVDRKKHIIGLPAYLSVKPVDKIDPSPSKEEMEEMDKAIYEPLAKKLDTHDAIIKLFVSYYLQSWPEDDKQPDQLPENYDSDHQTPDDSPTASKRTASQLEEEASEGGSGRYYKVARTGTRTSVSRRQ